MPRNEFERKQDRIRALLTKKNLDALLLQRVSSFAWATCGAQGFVNVATTTTKSLLLIAPSGLHIITNNIEEPRLEQEERLGAQGWQFHVAPWHEAQNALADLTRGLRLGTDWALPGATDLSRDISRMRTQLEPEEIVRMRELGRLCAETMNSAARAVRPGQTEYEIASLIAREAQRRGVRAIVNLVATDGRAYEFRHPLPTAKRLERHAMLVMSGRRQGLVCSITRLVHFGKLDDELRRKAEAVSQVDAALIANTCPGRTLGEIFSQAVATYAATGFPDEWRRHHQGGVTGYESRECLATPGSTETVSAGQAYAWNPSIAGTKNEDTILVTDAGQEVLTTIPGWPVLQVSAGHKALERPSILEIL